MEEKELVLDELEEVAGGAQKIGDVLIVNCQHACHARKGPGKKYEEWGHAYAGSVYSFYGWSGNWAKLKIDGHIKYVYKDFIQVL